MPFFDFRDPDADAEPLGSSFDFLRLDLRLEESRAVCCGEVSPDMPEDCPALDMSAGAAAFLPLLRSSAGVTGASGSALLPPRALLGFRFGGWACGGASAAALRLREAAGGGRVGGEPASVAVDGEASVAWLSALSLAAEERVTLCDMGKYVFG